MPIFKVPVIHRFGILSNRQHKELQKEFLRKYFPSHSYEIRHDKPLNPLEITENFIQKFNDATNPQDKKDLLELAKKMLARCKRRSGLGTLGSGKHVDLPVAWTEAIILAQCKGEIQEEALDILLISLDHAPMNPEQVPVLFFIAESILYRICYDAAQKSYLYSSEIKLSKVGFLVFLRLLVFHLCGHLKSSGEHTYRLYIDLKALSACEVCYQPYPNILSAVHFMLKAGETICGAVVLSDLNLEEIQKQRPRGMSFLNSDPSVQIKLEQKENKIQPFLWHSLVVWVCIHNNSSRLDEVLQHLLFYKDELHQKNWLDSVLGLLVLGEAAKLNLSCLKVLMDLVRDFISSSMSLQKQKDSCMQNLSSWSWEIGYVYTTVLRDICLNGIISDLQKTAFLGFCDCTKPPKHPEELRGASFFDLLQYSPSDGPHDCEELFWVIRYGVVYNLVVMCNELCGDVSREGLRNAMWNALQKQKNNERDGRVLEAVRVAEAEANGPANPFISSSANAPSSPRTLISCQYVGWRVASALSQVYLPPTGPNIPLPSKSKQKVSPVKYQYSEQRDVEKRTARPSLSGRRSCRSDLRKRSGSWR
ncbi:transmembrane protein 232 isoform X2 [Pelodiscus sinensis]|uniref:transmembrane protein 232 isoform X2 n=1 Tax=Pelodiscus sinensis TaxID=13735 RepID=UPI000D71E207|nr:transmembrane protein 232 isoform X2 [Pelodiscus sinensis]|eukprot:XP_025046182.1 transmembrane protein 232 isoform X2 [Pelodiscus sinensis]